MSERASEWGAERVRALRRHLAASQAELGERLGTRQQTVSEWETGSSRPRRMSRRLLQLVAEESGFYGVECPSPPPPERAP
ncbi:MAG: helix-turn-helix domain-containing protein [Dehalococcoidia bacterium]|nr:helix-turn-helix domain-containing protein [Dehalococcoidia bacterium]